MTIYDYLLLFVSVMAGGLSFFLIRKPGPYLLKLLLSFSGAFLFALSVLHLMPEVYQNGTPGIGAWIMAGFFLQIIMEFFSEGIEHGHIHVHHHHGDAFPMGMMISLSLHSFLEGMPLVASQISGANGIDKSLLFGIILHHLPVAFALTSMLMASAIGKTKTILFLMLFAFMAPLGALAASLTGGASSFPKELSDKLMAVVIGIFLHISTTILFESGKDHRFNLYKMVAIVTGGVMGLLAS